MHKLFPCLVLFALFCACNDTTTVSTNSHRIKVTEAHGYVVPKDSVQPPVVTPVGIPEPFTPGEPIINNTNLNVHVAGQPKVVVAGTPTKNTPGVNGILSPTTIASIGKTTPAGIPQVVIAKDAIAKDLNPANFSINKTLQGLPHNTIRCMLQDKAGNIWFCTNGGGVSRYDGKSFTTFTEKEGLNGNVVLCMLQDKAGNFWFGTYGAGVCRYDGKTFTSFSENEGLANNAVFSMLEDSKGNIWFGTNNGASCYAPDARVGTGGTGFTNYSEKEGLPDIQIYCMIEDKTGNIWFGTNQGACYLDQKKTFAVFTEQQGLCNNTVYSILEDRNGNIWFGTNGGACRYDKKTFTTFTQNEGLVNDVVVSLLEEKSAGSENDGIWFGTNGGASHFDGKTFTNFTEDEGISRDIVLSLLEDNAGQLWFGTLGAGVCRYDGKSFTNFSDKEGLSSNVVYAIFEDKTGTLWFGTDGSGICLYNGSSFTNFTEQQGLTNIANIIEDKSGSIWFDTDGALFRYDPQHAETEGQGKTFFYYGNEQGLTQSTLTIKEDKTTGSGEIAIWLGTNGSGACLYDASLNDTTYTWFTEEQGLSNNYVYDVLEDKAGNTWFATQRGVSCLHEGSFTNFTEAEGLTNNGVLCMLEDNAGNIWFGTNGNGVIRYDGKDFTHFTDKEGLCNNAVLNILQDAAGNIWFGTRKGLSKLTTDKIARLSSVDLTQPDNNFDPIKEALFYNYGYNDGFLGLNCRRNAVFQDSKGRIWWGADLLTCYNPAADIADTTAPVVNLTSVKLFGEEIAWTKLNAVYTDSAGNEIVRGTTNDTLLPNGILLKDIQFDGLTNWNNLPEHLSLPYNNNNLTFHFVGVHMQSRNHIKYQYKLEGMDPDWSSITDRTEAPYGNLPSGDYIFKIKAMNQSGVWSSPVEFAFVVRPPWWQTLWFRITVLAFIVSGIWLYIKRRERKLRIEKEILEQTVEERTAEVVEEKKIVEQKNILVEAQKNVIEEKHREITDSINYAERIQRSFMATKELLDENLKEYFVFFQPKDVVSGDFYWASKVTNANGAENFLLATADSTGHGVPGAIMSLLNISSLEKSIEHETEPAAILDNTRKTIIDRLKNDGSREGGRDGMDCSLISFNYAANTLTYAAANNPVWIIREGELREYTPDKMPVGKHEKDAIPFTQQTVELKKGDVVYTFTDGVPDQFGGPKGKKFMYKQLKELLISIAHEPLDKQKLLLKNTFDNWKGDLEQIDDVCVIGVRMV